MSFTGGVPLNAIINWGAADVNNGAGTRVLPTGWSAAVIDTNTPRGFRLPRAGVLRNFTARHNQAAGNGQPVQYVIRRNGVNTALSVSIATGVVSSGVNEAQVVCAAGDLIECIRINALAIGDGKLDTMCSCEFMGAAFPGTLSL